jgi:hypothetical protein
MDWIGFCFWIEERAKTAWRAGVTSQRIASDIVPTFVISTPPHLRQHAISQFDASPMQDVEIRLF